MFGHNIPRDITDEKKNQGTKKPRELFLEHEENYRFAMTKTEEGRVIIPIIGPLESTPNPMPKKNK